MIRENKSGLFTDLWALGCIIYEISCGQKMFNGKNNKEIFDKILDYEFQFPPTLDYIT
jgi:serine/threonine protein kinase